MQAKKIPHNVLNAKQHAREAQIVAEAGMPGNVTIATNMAGRGTDIRLAPGVAEMGGLHVLATERHDARRVDRQLFGRSGRQGDPGSYQAIVSLEDEAVANIYSEPVLRFCKRFSQAGKPLPYWLGVALVGIAQRIAERRHARMRSDLLRIDDQVSDMLAFTGRAE